MIIARNKEFGQSQVPNTDSVTLRGETLTIFTCSATRKDIRTKSLTK